MGAESQAGDRSPHEEQVFTYLLETGPVVNYVSTMDAPGQCSFVSPNVYSIFGCHPEQYSDPPFWSAHIHPDDRADAVSRIKRNLREGGGIAEYRFRHNDGVYRHILDHHRVTVRQEGKSEIVGCWLDITAYRRSPDVAEQPDAHDRITGLINQREFQNRLQGILSWSETIQHVLCYIDIDEFKIINNSHGRTAGDELLRQLAGLLKTVLSRRDLLGYMGADQFGVLLQHCSLNQAYRILERIQSALHEFRFSWNDKSHVLTASMGMVVLDRHLNSEIDILDAAIVACELAKEGGRNRIEVYSGEDQAIHRRREGMLWVEKINRALEEDRYLLYYQPIVSLDRKNSDRHFELLIRMKDEQGELVPPGMFLPSVERYHLSGKLDRWVIQTTLSWLEAYSELLDRDICWGINLSGQSLSDEHLLQFVFEELHYKNIPPQKICFEITETAAIENIGKARQFIETLRGKGCRFALDDFGSGLSSFAYLKNLPADILKIDGLFVRNIVEDKTDFAMVKAIHEIARSMGKITIAEFVEDDAIRRRLEQIGVNYAQGYGIARPKSLADFDQHQG